DALRELVDRADLDELTRFVDRLTEHDEWDDLVDVRNDCRAAAARGKQLWPVTAYVNYVLALRGPGRYAAAAINDAAGPGAAAARFGFGPLTEVGASAHSWTDLASHLAAGPTASLVAHECVLRGEDLTQVDGVDGSLLDVPLVLADWEPDYELATYKLDKAEFPSPEMPERVRWSELELSDDEVDEDDDALEGRQALDEIAAHWNTESNGRTEAVGVSGDIAVALRALGLTYARVAIVSPSEAFAHISWAAASGGAHGRRRGAANGRFAAWWTAAALVDLGDDWPVTANELEVAVNEMQWFLWDDGNEPIGWSLHLGVEDPRAELAWALVASDAD
ncbi:MAG: hypothetical protein H0U92_06250, partial [Actinobacteria bacterium]|nr:hypothetical protein [Actinomycetota bacterium]